MNVAVSGWEGEVQSGWKTRWTEAPPAFTTDGQTDGKTADALPMGMTTPNTATVRFSPRRKCSLPAEVREREREVGGQIRAQREGG